MDEQVTLVERLDLGAIQGVYVTEDPRDDVGVMMWCGYCCAPLHYDSRHMGLSPFLSLMAKMADAHRETECPKPKGPFDTRWCPRDTRLWEQWQQEAHRRALEVQGS